MDTIQAMVLVTCQQVCRTNVGRQHAFFNHLVRIITGARQNLLDLANRIADDIGFGGFEINCATPLPRLQQGLVHIV